MIVTARVPGPAFPAHAARTAGEYEMGLGAQPATPGSLIRIMSMRPGDIAKHGVQVRQVVMGPAGKPMSVVIGTEKTTPGPTKAQAVVNFTPVQQLQIPKLLKPMIAAGTLPPPPVSYVRATGQVIAPTTPTPQVVFPTAPPPPMGAPLPPAFPSPTAATAPGGSLDTFNPYAPTPAAPPAAPDPWAAYGAPVYSDPFAAAAPDPWAGYQPAASAYPTYDVWSQPTAPAPAPYAAPDPWGAWYGAPAPTADYTDPWSDAGSFDPWSGMFGFDGPYSQQGLGSWLGSGKLSSIAGSLAPIAAFIPGVGTVAAGALTAMAMLGPKGGGPSAPGAAPAALANTAGLIRVTDPALIAQVQQYAASHGGALPSGFVTGADGALYMTPDRAAALASQQARASSSLPGWLIPAGLVLAGVLLLRSRK